MVQTDWFGTLALWIGAFALGYACRVGMPLIVAELRTAKRRRGFPALKPQLLLWNLQTRSLIVMNVQLKNTSVLALALLVLDASGDVVPAPDGDTYTVTSGDTTKLNAVLGILPAATGDGVAAAGAPCVTLNALVNTASSIPLTVSDAKGLQIFSGAVDIVADLTPTKISLDVASPVVVGTQPAPAS